MDRILDLPDPGCHYISIDNQPDIGTNMTSKSLLNRIESKTTAITPFICVKVPNCLIEMSLFPPSPLLLLLSNDLPILSTILEADRTFFTHTEGT